VNKILDVSEGGIRLTRMLDDGVETLEAPLPIVISVSKDINQPRLATLRGRLGARKAEIRQLTSNDIDAEPSQLGLDGSPTRVVKIFTPTPPTGGEVVHGTPEELAQRIFEKLVECKVI